jgi:hypothetical protein
MTAAIAESGCSRVAITLRKLARHDIDSWAITGGLAIEIHDPRPALRRLNDIDFVAPDFQSIPASLARDFLFRHVHTNSAPGGVLVQFVDPETALRVDVFGACGDTLRRATNVVSAADLLARLARLTLDLAVGDPTPAKHADDYRRLVGRVPAAEVEIAWCDHRKPRHPATFAAAREILRELITARPDLLITPEYSKDPAATCPRCICSPAFPLADPNIILGLLGYC